MTRAVSAEIVVVGGGLAGAAVAAHLGRAGREVVLVEKAPRYRWRACGVFSSPAAVEELRSLGLSDQTIGAVTRSIPAMRVEARGGASFRLTYGAERPGRERAVGFDRAALDPAVLDLARSAGANVRTGEAVTAVRRRESTGWNLSVRGVEGEGVVCARLLIGADGIRSLVARELGVARRPALGGRIGLTYHLDECADRAAPRDGDRDARMVVFAGGYCGIAPVPGGRMNVGIVLAGRGWQAAVRRDGAAAVCEKIVRGLPVRGEDDDGWRAGARCEPPAGAHPVGQRVRVRAGDGWLLVGDAAGFLDPFTGEGIHRALVSARFAAEAVEAHLRGRSGAFDGYSRAMDARFRSKDLVSWLVQAFLAAPPLFEYAARRLASRSPVRQTMGLAIGDLIPAGRALDPRFLAALLAP